MKPNDLLDIQYLDNNYERYYFIPYPECKFFDDMDADDFVIPVNTQIFQGSFVDARWIADGCEEDS